MIVSEMTQIRNPKQLQRRNLYLITGDTEHLATPELPVERMALVHVDALLRRGIFGIRSNFVV
jgi:hypothetical protein